MLTVLLLVASVAGQDYGEGFHFAAVPSVTRERNMQQGTAELVFWLPHGDGRRVADYWAGGYEEYPCGQGSLLLLTPRNDSEPIRVIYAARLFDVVRLFPWSCQRVKVRTADGRLLDRPIWHDLSGLPWWTVE